MGRWMHCVFDLFVRLCVPGGGFSGWLIGDFFSSIYIFMVRSVVLVPERKSYSFDGISIPVVGYAGSAPTWLLPSRVALWRVHSVHELNGTEQN